MLKALSHSPIHQLVGRLPAEEQFKTMNNHLVRDKAASTLFVRIGKKKIKSIHVDSWTGLSHYITKQRRMCKGSFGSGKTVSLYWKVGCWSTFLRKPLYNLVTGNSPHLTDESSSIEKHATNVALLLTQAEHPGVAMHPSLVVWRVQRSDGMSAVLMEP